MRRQERLLVSLPDQETNDWTLQIVNVGDASDRFLCWLSVEWHFVLTTLRRSVGSILNHGDLAACHFHIWYWSVARNKLLVILYSRVRHCICGGTIRRS